MREKPQAGIDEEFDRTVADWREQHGLREDDAVLLLIELFRIHQRHWDEVRHREMPSFQQFRADLTKLSETAHAFQNEAAALLAALRIHPAVSDKGQITLTSAVFAALASLITGYLIGRAWP